MKALALFFVSLACFANVSAQSNKDYPLTVHVRSSYVAARLGNSQGFVSNRLAVTIDGKKYVLDCDANGYLFALGDYPAKLTKDEHKTSYEFRQLYTLLFPDGKTKDFTVVEISE